MDFFEKFGWFEFFCATFGYFDNILSFWQFMPVLTISVVSTLSGAGNVRTFWQCRSFWHVSTLLSVLKVFNRINMFRRLYTFELKQFWLYTVFDNFVTFCQCKFCSAFLTTLAVLTCFDNFLNFLTILAVRKQQINPFCCAP